MTQDKDRPHSDDTEVIEREIDALFDEMQRPDFEDRVRQALSVDEETMAEIARKAIAAERYD